MRRALMTGDLVFGDTAASATDTRPGGSVAGTTRLAPVVLGRMVAGTHRLRRTATTGSTRVDRGGGRLGRRQLIGPKATGRTRGTTSDAWRTTSAWRTREPWWCLQQLKHR